MSQIRRYIRLFLKFLTIMMCASLLLTGCQTKRIINMSGFIQTVTIDKSDVPNEYFFGITFPELKPDGTTKSVYMAYKASNFEEAYDHFILQTRFTLLVGQTRNIVVGKSLAEEGLLVPAITNLLLQPKFPITSRLMVYDGEARDFLKLGEDITDFNLYRLLIKMQSFYKISISTVFNFVRDYIENGSDPYTFIVRIKSKSASLHGSAVFSKQGKWVGTLNEQETTDMLMMRSPKFHTFLHLDKQQGNAPIPITMQNAQSERTIKVLETKPFPKILITMNIKGTLDTTLSELTSDQTVKEPQVEQAIEQQLTKTIRKLQELKSDPVGFGMFVRNKMPYEEWDDEKWPDMFKQAEIQCKVKFNLENKI
ncbi:Ger(x)C family spore germination protein [Paenibacillus sp. SC116]|uniref:Ger(x)C family spore germination protein n=1 Tax=Paenibacillus sp. SC116 TaxID=2968986 RepID=UPI00215B3C32|nr:Ger(x)C family spore germination protein [Paenibacillus sp. SC116]MCR8843471.1 Ger(x)C family spore germination protein [Paenibacillus sp. SC116]